MGSYMCVDMGVVYSISLPLHISRHVSVHYISINIIHVYLSVELLWLGVLQSTFRPIVL